MAKSTIEFVCSECGHIESRWVGVCPECKEPATMEEQYKNNSDHKAANYGKGADNKRSGYAGNSVFNNIVSYDDIDDSKDDMRYDTNIDEFNRVLGGDGLVKGSVVLLVGDPGIGKSTILLQVLSYVSSTLNVLYVSGEESLKQIKNRSKRLNLDSSKMSFLAETNVERIISNSLDHKPQIMVVDSIQTIYTENSTSMPGGTTQIRESTSHLTRYAKENDVSIIMVGHVTKDGSLAGPKILEHIIDTAIYIEGEQGSKYRIMRPSKNRFGDINEIGIFAMTDKGLKPVTDPSKIFLSKHGEDVPGSSIMVTKEGTRPMLLEIQALVSDTQAERPKRLSIGLEHNRLSLILAILHRYGKFYLANKDVYVNVIGGVKVTETASDLSVAFSVISSFLDIIIPPTTAIFGELGLSGEIRPVPNGEDRVKEAIKHGFKNIVLPTGNKLSFKPNDDVHIHRLSVFSDIKKTIDIVGYKKSSN
jgi:DNA repair protein RadA/Sms